MRIGFSVLNNWFLADNETESDLWDKREKSWPKGQLAMAKRKSWERMFDLNRAADPAWCGTRPPDYIQACFWVLEASMVVKERWFTAR
jgi:uncharacterized protein YcaQ